MAPRSDRAYRAPDGLLDQRGERGVVDRVEACELDVSHPIAAGEEPFRVGELGTPPEVEREVRLRGHDEGEGAGPFNSKTGWLHLMDGDLPECWRPPPPPWRRHPKALCSP